MELGDTATALDPFVAAAARGDRDAFAKLVKSTASLVSSIALAIVGDVELSRDIAQNVFLATWRELGRLRQPSSFLPWLRQTTRNQANQALRNRVRARRMVSDQDAEALLAAASDPRPTAGERLIEEEEGRRLAEAIESLPDATREVVTLYYREGCSARQVAELLGLREEAVKQRLARARTALRESLLDELGRKLERTAPGAAFGLAVMASLASPTTASAAAAAAAGSKTLGGGWLALAAPIGGTVLGAVGGLAGIFVGIRRSLAGARDDRERLDLRRFAAAAAAAVVLAAAAFLIADLLNTGPWAPIGIFAGLVATLAGLQLFWLPRIVRRRLTAERGEVSSRWAAIPLRVRVWAIAGWSVGLLGGILGLVAGL